MHVAEIWRYPVKSMGGERLTRARVGLLGIDGDRVVQVRGSRGRAVTARTHPQLLRHHAVLDPAGMPIVDGLAWTDPRITEAIVADAGAGARLVEDRSEHRFDVLPLLVATDGAIAEFGRDGRRLRPNLVIGGVKGLSERTWPGQCLRIRDVRIDLVDLRARCVMTTYDPDTLKQDPQVLRDIVNRFDGTLALNAAVLEGGEIHEGDAVELADCAALA